MIRVPTLMENIRKKLLVDSVEERSRTIDVRVCWIISIGARGYDHVR